MGRSRLLMDGSRPTAPGYGTLPEGMRLDGATPGALRGSMGTPTTKPVRIPAPLDDEAELVAAAKAGDMGAFTELVKRYERKIFRLTLNITQNREDAEDAMQEAFLKAFKNFDSFQGDSRFYTWLVRIAVNEALMRLRKRRPGQVSIDEMVETEDDFMPREIEDWGPSPEQRYAQTELGEILSEAINKLDPAFRIVFQLRDMEELSTEETAEMLGLSVPAVKSRLLRARLKLRERLSKHFRQADLGNSTRSGAN